MRTSVILCAMLVLAWWIVMTPDGQWAGYVRLGEPGEPRYVEKVKDAEGRHIGYARRLGKLGGWELSRIGGEVVGTVDVDGRLVRAAEHVRAR